MAIELKDVELMLQGKNKVQELYNSAKKHLASMEFPKITDEEISGLVNGSSITSSIIPDTRYGNFTWGPGCIKTTPELTPHGTQVAMLEGEIERLREQNAALNRRCMDAERSYRGSLDKVHEMTHEALKQQTLQASLQQMEADIGKIRQAIGQIKMDEILGVKVIQKVAVCPGSEQFVVRG